MGKFKGGVRSPGYGSGDVRARKYLPDDPRFPNKSTESVFRQLVFMWDNRTDGTETINWHTETMCTITGLSNAPVSNALKWLKDNNLVSGEYDRAKNVYPIVVNPPEDMAVMTQMI